MPRNGSGSGVDTCYYAGTIPTTLEPYPSETVLEHLREEQHDRMRLLENHGKTIGFSYRSLKVPVLLSCFVFFPVLLLFSSSSSSYYSFSSLSPSSASSFFLIFFSVLLDPPAPGPVTVPPWLQNNDTLGPVMVPLWLKV